MRSPGRQLKIRLHPERLAHLDKMAAEAGVQPGALARAMLEMMLDDDAKAHAAKKDDAA